MGAGMVHGKPWWKIFATIAIVALVWVFFAPSASASSDDDVVSTTVAATTDAPETSVDDQVESADQQQDEESTAAATTDTTPASQAQPEDQPEDADTDSDQQQEQQTTDSSKPAPPAVNDQESEAAESDSSDQEQSTQEAPQSQQDEESEEAFSVTIQSSQQGSGPGTTATAVLSGNLDPTWRIYMYSVNDPGGSGNAETSSEANYGPGLLTGHGYVLPVPVAATDTPENALWIVEVWVLDSDSKLVGLDRFQIILPEGGPTDPEPTIIPLPADPTFTDPPGPNNATWDPQVNDDTYTWELTPEGNLTVRPTQPNTVFQGEESHDYGQAPDSYDPNTYDSDGDGVVDALDQCANTPAGTQVDGNGCPVVAPPTVVPVPAQPSVTDPSGPDNATWNQPANDDKHTWEVTPEGNLIVHLVDLTEVFPNGKDYYDYGQAPDSYVAPQPKPDVVVEKPATPGNVVDPDGPNNAHWDTVPGVRDNIIWTVNPDGSVHGELLKGFVFPDGTREVDFPAPADSYVAPPADNAGGSDGDSAGDCPDDEAAANTGDVQSDDENFVPSLVKTGEGDTGVVSTMSLRVALFVLAAAFVVLIWRRPREATE